MKNKSKNVSAEAKCLLTKSLNYDLVKIVSGDYKGSVQDYVRIDNLKKTLKKKFYVEALYILTHEIINEPKKAERVYFNIIKHRKNLSQKIKRNVGIEVAALDYMKNICSNLKKPEVIEKDKLFNLASKAVIDQSTGVYAKGVLSADLEEEIKRAKRYDRPLSLLFCDFDDFKKINDSFGHSAGDKALKVVSQQMKSSLRETDRLFRYGGEEFVCLLPETNLESALHLASRLRKKIEKNNEFIQFDDQQFRVTLSIGVSQYGVNGISNAEDLIKSADKAMYEAKKQGKNKVCVYGDNNCLNKKREDMIEKGNYTVAGQVLSSGFAMGKAFIYRDILSRDLFSYTIKEHEIKEELSRIRESLNEVSQDLHHTKKVVEKTVNKDNADIFEAQKIMLKDEKLLMDLEKELSRELVNAEQAVRNVFRRWANRFKSSNNEMVKDKAEDMDDLSRRVIRQLLGYERNALEELPPDSIIVARRLLPSDTVKLNKKNVKGIILQEGGYNSHSAILARGLGVPAVCSDSDEIMSIKKKGLLLIDGEKGKIIVNPDKSKITEFKLKVEEFNKYKSSVLKRSKEEAKTRNGKIISVYANASNVQDFQEALINGCNGIGLFRIESLYLSHKTAPSVDYLEKKMKDIIKTAKDKPVTVRLLDVGGDKRLSYINVEDERNPFLGSRGIRLLLKYENILKTQIEVLLKLSKNFNLRILVPMVSLPEEILKVKEIISGIENKIGLKGKVKLGAMIETPAAVINVEEIAKIADFLSIGTNDLIQYTMAVGRENMSMIQYYDEGFGTILKMIKKVVEAAKRNSISCCLCGELAGDEQYIEQILKTGLSEISLSPTRIPFVKEKIRAIRL